MKKYSQIHINKCFIRLKQNLIYLESKFIKIYIFGNNNKIKNKKKFF